MKSERDRQRKRRIAAAIVLLVVGIGAGLWVAHGRQANGIATAPAQTGATPAAKSPALGSVRTEPNASPPAVHAAVAPIRRMQSGAPLPPPGTPLAQIYDELDARADAGDADAAARLYRDVARCAAARDMLRSLPRWASRMLAEDTSKLSADQLSQREHGLAHMEDQLNQARRDNAACTGLTREQMQLAPLVLRAAQLGDLPASDCYVRGFVLLGDGLLDHPEWLAQYKDNAMAIAQAAVDRGDWNMVAALQSGYSQQYFGPLFQLLGVSPVENYRYLRLRRLGAADASTAADLDRQLADAAQGLSPDAMSASDAWARDMYASHFAPTTSGEIDTRISVSGCAEN